MLPFTMIAQAGAGLIEEVVRERRPLRGVLQTIGDWVVRLTDYLQKEESGPLQEFCEYEDFDWASCRGVGELNRSSKGFTAVNC